jgi:hypothetical protein
MVKQAIAKPFLTMIVASPVITVASFGQPLPTQYRGGGLAGALCRPIGGPVSPILDLPFSGRIQVEDTPMRRVPWRRWRRERAAAQSWRRYRTMKLASIS